MPCTRASALQPADDVDRARVAFRQRLQVDHHAPAVEGRVHPVDADERRQARDRRILQHHACERLLALGHGAERYALIGLGDAEDGTGVLDRKEALRHREVEHGGERQRTDRHQQGERLVPQNPVEHHAVAMDGAVEQPLARAVEAALLVLRRVLEQARAHHRRERERDHARDENRHREGHCKLPEQASHHIAHEQQRDQHRHQRDGERDDGEGDLLRALECCLQRPVAALEIARDVLDHDDGIVHHEAGCDHQRHQREIVDGKTGEIHEAERADQRQRHRHARNQGGAQVAQEKKDHQHHQADGEGELDLHVAHRGADGDGAIGQNGHVDGGRERSGELRQLALDTVDDLDHIGAGLALNVDDDRRHVVDPGGEAHVLRVLGDLGHIGQEYRRAVAVGDHHRAVLLGRAQLIVGVDHVGSARRIDIALRALDVGRDDRAAQVLQVEPIGGKRLGVRLHAHGGSLAARKRDQANAGHLRDLLRKPRIGEVLDLRQRQHGRRQPQRQDRRIGRIDLAVHGRGRQIIRQQVGSGIDCGLHALLGHVERHFEVELQGDHRGAAGAGRRHLLEPRDLAELTLQRRGDRRGKHLGAPAGIEGEDLDGGIVDVGQRRGGELTVCHDPRQQYGDHQQRGRHRPQDEKS
jgi:hypothetical protein